MAKIEVLVAYDQEDNITAEVAPHLMELFPWLKMYRIPRITNIAAYQNWLFRISNGKYIILVNDDCVFETMCWDTIAMSVIKERGPKDGVFYGWISDGHDGGRNMGRYSNMPLISKRSASILGYVMNEHFKGWTADAFLHSIFHKAGRVIDIGDVFIRHLSHKGDAAQRNIEDLSRGQVWLDNERDAQKIITFINHTNADTNPEKTLNIREEIKNLLVLLDKGKLMELRNYIYDIML